MAVYTKDGLKTRSAAVYADNGQGLITAESVRGFNVDMVDSVLVNEDWITANVTVKASSGVNLVSLKLKRIAPGLVAAQAEVGGWSGTGTQYIDVQISNFSFTGTPTISTDAPMSGDLATTGEVRGVISMYNANNELWIQFRKTDTGSLSGYTLNCLIIEMP